METTKNVFLPHESNRYTDRYPCGYCDRKNVYTRCFYNENVKWTSMFLCYNCGVDFVDKKDGWKLIESKITVCKEHLAEHV